ncbi:tyrosine-type recombinase/integrase [Planctomycetota bacterium]
MAGARKKPLKSGKYQGWYKNYEGKQTFFLGTSNRQETLSAAFSFQKEHKKIAIGELPKPEARQQHRNRPIKEVFAEYQAWGELRGRKDGKPWGGIHAHKTKENLFFWRKALKLKTLADLDNILSAVEHQMKLISDQKRAPRTIAHIVTSLRAFCNWAIKRKYLAHNPLAELGTLDIEPQKEYRAYNLDEVRRIFDVATPYERLLLMTAMVTGCRAGELGKLMVDDLDPKTGILTLRPAVTKNKKEKCLVLPRSLVEALLFAYHSGETARLYHRHNHRRKTPPPAGTLLFVSTHPSRELDRLRIKAGIPKKTKDGIACFHSLRSTFVSLVAEQGASVKELQSLARHSDPRLTMNVYAKSRDEREAQVIEGVFKTLDSGGQNANSMHTNNGSEPYDMKNRPQRALKPTGTDGGGGIRTPVP